MATKRPNRREIRYGLPKWRNWSENKLGVAHTEKPEKMRRLTYVLPKTSHQQIRAIQNQVKKILKLRERDIVSFFRGESGDYYVKATNSYEGSPVFFKITNAEVLGELKGKMIAERRARQKGLPKKRNWAENKLGIASTKKPERTDYLYYTQPKDVNEHKAKLMEMRKLNGEVKKLLKVRSGGQVIFLKGKKSENYYAKLTNSAGTGSIFFKITNQKILGEIKRIYI